MPPQAATHALYRFYDVTGTLLYIGITVDPGSRWRSHAHDKPWWQQITRIEIETHPTRAEVLEAEAHAIRRERPRHNVIHNRRTPRPRALVELDDTVLAIVGADPATGPFGTHPSHMPDDCHDHCVKAGTSSIYYPYAWRRGTAHYQCVRGHTWTCHWGHNRSGSAPENARRPAWNEEVATA